MTPRRQQILEVFAQELAKGPGTKLTTARLAAAVGVSEAALYRHFPSKAKMFEAMLEFAENTVFERVNRIMAEQPDPRLRCADIGRVFLRFIAANPGIARILLGDILLGEHARLQLRVHQFFERLETHYREGLRDALAGASQEIRTRSVAVANLYAIALYGRMAQYVRSGFRLEPEEHWCDQAAWLAGAIFTSPQ